MESFELLDYYDEYLGHYMWYAPLFLAYIFYFHGCFAPASHFNNGTATESRGDKSEPSTTMPPPISSPGMAFPLKLTPLLLFSALYEWYLVTEGQIFQLFLLMVFAMLAVFLLRLKQGMLPDSNGKVSDHL